MRAIAGIGLRQHGPRAVGSARPRAAASLRRHVIWLAGAYVLSFAVPFVLADQLELQRDVYYGIYAALVAALCAAWIRDTGQSLAEMVRRRWRLAVALGGVAAIVSVAIVLGTEDPTPRPGGVELAGALLWRGLVYGAADGVLLTAFPIMVVLAAAASTPRERRPGRVAVGAVALAASLLMTATYHLGYRDFRSDKVRRPVAGDLVWSAPVLATLNPVGAPIAHVGLHVAAVAHSYDTDLFLPPHASGT